MLATTHMIQMRKHAEIRRRISSTHQSKSGRVLNFSQCGSRESHAESSVHTLVAEPRYLLSTLVYSLKGQWHEGVMTLTVHLVGRTIRRSWVARVLEVVVAVLLQLLNPARGGLILTGNLSARLVADRGELNRSARLWVARRRGSVGGLPIRGNGRGSCTILISLTLILFLLLARLPLLSDFFELCHPGYVSVLTLHKPAPQLRLTHASSKRLRLSPVRVRASLAPMQKHPASREHMSLETPDQLASVGFFASSVRRINRIHTFGGALLAV